MPLSVCCRAPPWWLDGEKDWPGLAGPVSPLSCLTHSVPTCHATTHEACCFDSDFALDLMGRSNS